MVDDIGAPIDVLWMRLTRRPSDGAEPLGRMIAGKIFVMIDRGDYWQCAFVIAKGGYEEVKADGSRRLPRRHRRRSRRRCAIASASLQSWDDIKLLTVTVDRLRQWYRPGLLCIGDAAHAMSPVGGVGINLAIQDAVAAANILAGPLRAETLSVDDLAAVQQRRTFPTRATQWLQVQIQNRILSRVLTTPRGTIAALAAAGGRPLPLAAADSGAHRRRRFPAGARAEFGSSSCGASAASVSKDGGQNRTYRDASRRRAAHGSSA